jgi:nitrate reductase gamma subunit
LLSASTTLNYLTNASGAPMSLTNPVRILGNLGGIMLIAGLALVVYRISVDTDKREVTSAPDYLFIGLLLLAGFSGFLSEYVSEIDAVAWMYGVYVAHLLLSAALLLLAPFTRFVHALGRPIIRLSERYLEALNQQGIVIPSELTVMPLLKEAK